MKNKIFQMMFVALSLILTACGSGGGGGGSDAGSGNGGGAVAGQDMVVSGTMTKGSVIVNGIRFTVASGASIVIDDNPGTETGLDNGMQVHVRGRVNEDRVTGEADMIEAENEVQGVVTAKNIVANPDFIIVLGQTVFFDDLTVFANDGGLKSDAITAGTTVVEVHGQRDANGNIHATRIEIKTGANAAEAELKGTITNLTATTFTIGIQTVNFASGVIIPAGAALANGNLVEVKGTLSAGIIEAARVELEDVEDAEFQPAEGEDFAIEGFIAGFTAHPGTFKVGAASVTTTSATEFRNGSSADLANGVAVEAEGTVSGGALQAGEIKFSRKVIRIITDDLTIDFVSGFIAMMGKTVAITDLTQNTEVTDATARVEMRGYIDSTGSIIASEIKDAGTSQGNKDILQAELEAENEAGSTLTLLGITANVNAAEFQNDDGSGMSKAEFFAAVTPKTSTSGGTIVKVKGTFSGSTITAEEAEIED